ncbi:MULTISPECIES: ABC transporter substrate-binding protein [Streptomyces]|uniref:Carbohydrate ABC transporter substrate-binding protein n=1 Tax=Streptomyces cinereoruber TaxID=67260 RepID=A0AAV4KD17_9ACTN|nr:MULTISPECIES: ABC transporter substrate-binding protein [Streptomyces]AVH94412.1 carbohydrate ABC transporter substrate-binding protein [Streptomyces sp. WAC00288]KYG53142.1 sugar-binding protein [Streptomyces sp. WAC04657]MBB4157989.1 cellobiose transport system substrate-binding protein [Streptomyces cinereoruber]MBY8816105.1 ABC transporter substrate-binding protein [Streptomyces cinereoruber]NIH61858.1 cellobiose transport system substrate-binding protein [Streptomyces cinereoruber]
MRTSSSRRGRRTAVAAVAVVMTGTSLLTGCGSDDDDAKSGGTITLRVGTFGSFGYDDKTGAKLYAEYEKTHPGIKIEESNVADGQKYWDTLKLRLSRNSGLADIQAIEVGYIAEATGPTMADKWVDLGKEGGAKLDAFLDWKVKQATTADGSVIGLGTDIGPMAVCYNKDLFAKAGLPTDRDAVAKLWSGDWSKFLETGRTYQKNAPAGTAFHDSASGLFNAVVSSDPVQYADASGKLDWENSPGVKTAWDTAVAAAQGGLTAKLRQFDEKGTWNAAFKNSKFATVACPSWMTGIIKDQAGPANQGKWDIAAPPVAGNWGGAFLAVPKSGKHAKEAAELAAWLTAPEQHAKVFAVNGNIPSSKDTLTSVAVQEAKLPYFGDTPVGKIFSSAAARITPASISRWDGQVKTFLTDNGILDIEQRGTDPAKAWENVKKLVDDKIDQ